MSQHFDKIMQTPDIERALELARHVVSLDCLGAITGIPGTGKTEALLTIQSKYPGMGLPGKCAFVRCCGTEGSVSGVKQILASLGMKEAANIRGLSLELAIKMSVRLFQHEDYRLLLLDEAELMDAAALEGVISMADILKLNRHPIGMIMTGIQPAEKWIGSNNGGASRTVRSEVFREMSPAMALSLLREWKTSFARLSEKVEQKDKEAGLYVKLIHKGTGGNLRRLKFFAQLYGLLHADADVTKENILLTFEKMTHEELS
ncbi:ATP-binding protein [Kamptonema cortianum]|nr:ATP-binding protein [Oscillatoria laete-virens]MDK3155740.1 ATP-binding protein [Kamptonema cortianum]MDL5048039.1 ATP-binding protein [Oscillatoria amoena NRMC-F 0135]MDL5052521.1 ATP-binding protein [Oscillatoria laete-virens NRMC-F 0139]